MKKYILLVFGFVYAIGFGQSGNVNNEIDLPKIIYPTPEAAKFTQYGEIPVNESTGNATTTIPLLNYKAGRLETSINLSHNGGGVKVDDVNTIVGVSWLLNAGGIITRTVNDIVDEDCGTGDRVFHSSSELLSYVPDQDPELARIVKNTGVDTEVDIFNYNFGNYSGSFFFDENMQPRLIKYDKELKIQISEKPIVDDITVPYKRTITITTTDGTKYYFGGLNASEVTRNNNGTGQNTPYAQTGFYLFKIENIHGDIINFNYSNSSSTLEVIGYSQILKKDVSLDGQNDCNIQFSNTLLPPTASHLETQGKLRLLSITNNRDESRLVFEYYSVGVPIWKFYLDKIKYFKSNSNIDLLKKVDLEYLLPDQTYEKRFFLEEIKIYGDNSSNSPVEKYTLEYNNPSGLPDRFSFSQDYAGYYNGKNNNSFVPKVSSPVFMNSNLSSLADRTANEFYSKYGTLQKIIYPTGGFTNFEYELSYKGEEPVTYPNYFTASFQDPRYYNETSQCHQYSSNYRRYYETFNPYVDGTLNLTVQTNIYFTLDGLASGTYSHQAFVRLIARNLSNNQETYFEITIPSSTDPQNFNITSNNFLVLNPGNYDFRLEIRMHNADSNPCVLQPGQPSSSNSVYCTVTLNMPSEDTISTYYPSPRIKRLISSPNENGEQMITRYYYNKAANKSNLLDTRTNVNEPHFINDLITRGSCNVGGTGGFDVCTQYTLNSKTINSSPQNSIYLSDSNNSMYEYVTVSYGGDNFEKGGKQSQFFIQSDLPIAHINSIYYDTEVSSKVSNNSLKNGTLLNEIIFKSSPVFDNNTGEFISGKVKEVDYSYLSINEKNYAITNFFASKLMPPPQCVATNINYSNYVSNYYFGRYYTFSWWHTLGSTVTKEYLSNGNVETTVNYYYDNTVKFAGLPSRTVTTNSSLESIESKYYYPGYAEVQGEPNVGGLFLYNILENPIKTEFFKNNIKISEQKTIYDEQLLPFIIQTSKGTPSSLESRIRYNSYDLRGNPLEVQKENGMKICYIWGYNKTQPVAKIENIQYSAIPQNLITAIQSATDSPTGTEAQVITALNALRSSTALSSAMVTTITYKPLIGVSTVTDAKGMKTTYEYDSFGRLKAVRDNDGNILSENKYHYRTE